MKVLIAGASRGIGLYLANELSREGYVVFGTYNANHVAVDFDLSQVDVTDDGQVRQWIDSIEFKSDDKFVLINCVGVNYNVLLHKSDTDAWMKVIETNLKGSYLLLKYILPRMRECLFGRIILLSSVVPQLGVPGTSAYAASKSALWGLAKATAMENVKYGVTVNTINLGYMKIGMIADVPPNMLEIIKAQIPMGKLGDPSNILRTIKFLIETDYITGSQININGGLY